MTARTTCKVCGLILVFAGIPFLAGVGCPSTSPVVPGTTTGPNSSSVLGMVVNGAALGGTIDVDILQGGVSILGGPQAPVIPDDQSYGTTEYEDVAVVGGVTVRMAMVTTDAFGESQHTVSFYFSGWIDDGDGVHDPMPPWGTGGDVPAALPALDLTAVNNIVIRVGNIGFRAWAVPPPANRLGPGTPDLTPAGVLSQITQVEARISGAAVNWQGRPYVLYMREGPAAAGAVSGRYYALTGSRATIPDPATIAPQDPAGTIPDTYSVQVPGDYFFDIANAAEYGSDMTGGPFGVIGDGGTGNARGEFEYTIFTPAFINAANQQVLLDPENPAVPVVPPAVDTDPFADPANLTPGSTNVHELAVACTFLTQP